MFGIIIILLWSISNEVSSLNKWIGNLHNHWEKQFIRLFTIMGYEQFFQRNVTNKEINELVSKLDKYKPNLKTGKKG